MSSKNYTFFLRERKRRKVMRRSSKTKHKTKMIRMGRGAGWGKTVLGRRCLIFLFLLFLYNYIYIFIISMT